MKKIINIFIISILLLISIMPNSSAHEEETTLKEQQEEFGISEFIEQADEYSGEFFEDINMNDILENAIKDAVKNLNIGGRIAIITFHSLEDRIVKNIFNYLALDCICPKQFPICKCEKKKEIKIINKKPILPSSFEIEKNSRSSSAKLRVAEKIN